MKVAHITPAFHPAYTYGGPIESVYQLCRGLARDGCDVKVLTTDTNGPQTVLDVDTKRETLLADNVSVRYCRRRSGHTIAPTLLGCLPSYVRWADVVHLTAVYSFPTIPTLLTCKMLGKPVVWSPRGALQRWEGSTRLWGKALWEWVCRLAAPQQLLLHVTSEEEAVSSQKRIPQAEVAISPNGIEIPDQCVHLPGGEKMRLLYLGRLHPIKGIENLLIACQALNERLGIGWSLTIAGSGETRYIAKLRQVIKELALSEHVTMVGEVFGKTKEQLFQGADLVVVPSFSENFGIVAAEALARGVPVIIGKGAPWKRVEEIGCGLWVDNTPEILAEAIERTSKMPLKEMGQKGRLWMRTEFAWEQRAQEMLSCYRTLQEKRESIRQ